MADFRYKAYISYSHRDERWATWLHRALESYSVPGKLVGQNTQVGEVPARIRPVFRDRDDLSSATDLGSTVKQALAESENLIVVCSPDAVISHWVNEEIREFARLGRTDRIFCIIVGGDRAEGGSVSACFPPALVKVGLHEPLAADVRNWADGRHVAKLKLIAGLLGIPLDEIRQRDLQRRRKRKAVAGLGVVAALALAVITVVSQVSQRHEREKAEQLATFIVDLGEHLQSDVDLETLDMISAEAFKHLQGLDTDKLSPEIGKKVALALRQMGRVSQLQGRPDEALEAFNRSRVLFSSLNKRYPEIPGLLFELGNAEYFIGALYVEQDLYESALESMQKYHHLTRSLLKTDPDNPDWIMELSYSHNNLAAVRLDSGMDFDAETQAHVAEAVRLAEVVKALRPEDETVADGYATVLAWASDAQQHSCNLINAMSLRARVTALRSDAAQSDPGNNDLKRRFAFDLGGLGKLLIQLGMLDAAEQNLELSTSLLQQLSAADPSNVPYREDVLLRQFWLAKVIGENGQPNEARLMMQTLEPKFRLGMESAGKGTPATDEYIDLLIALADIESRLGETRAANDHLQAAMRLQEDRADLQAWDSFDTQRVQRARYQWWEQNGEEGLERFAVQTQTSQEPVGNFQSCAEADMAARMYIIAGDIDHAADEVAYLRGKGYAEPAFMRFCSKHELCEPLTKER